MITECNFDIIIKGKMYTNVVCINDIYFYYNNDKPDEAGYLQGLKFIYLDDYNRPREVCLDGYEDGLKDIVKFIRKERNND